ncbi:hypothetical protein SMC26_28505 [Actinomadura fulvescens]|uniref:Uncharacterized protein n=1 Tax=Actinomadura fulvescens TaxID=46160 RepID=A0ABP6BMM2_9ACTN
MTEQPGDVLDEAVKLFDSLWRRIGGDDARDRGAASAGDDVWSRATAGDPRIATGAPECRDCPICRAIALARESGPDVTAHVRQAGRSLMAAAFDVLAAYERTREPRTPDRSRRSAHSRTPDRSRQPAQSRPPGASRPADGPRPAGGPSSDPWAEAARDEPMDIG